MPISVPPKIATPWATSGLKNSIPSTADPINGLAGYDQGFPAINMTPKTAGGIPPFGQDFNGVFFDITKAIQFLQAGGSFPYDSAWATAVGGYPVGALVSRTDNQGFWRNTMPNNLTDPEAGGAGWQPEGSGATSLSVSGSNITLTALQASRAIIIISGALLANIQVVFPAYVRQWLVLNNTTGSFTITCKTASGSGVTVAQGVSTLVYGDGTNIGNAAQTGFDYLNTARIDIASTSNINLTVAAPNTSNINITGTTTINGFTVAVGRLYFVRFDAALTITNSGSLVTQSGANITTAAGDTCVIRATADNVVEVLYYTPGIPQEIGYRQTYQNVLGSRLLNTTYTNSTGRPIMVMVSVNIAPGVQPGVVVNGTTIGAMANNGSGATVVMTTFPVGSGSTYSINGGTSVAFWTELR